MSDDYLWDRSGPPDPEIARLEQQLAPLRYRHRATLAGAPPKRSRAWMAAAALVLAAIAGMQLRTPVQPLTAWQVAGAKGSPLAAGEVLRTGSDEQVTLQSDAVGTIDLFPNSELRANTHQMMLNRGKLHAFIWARPGRFVVETPSARAVDLGCEYTITVDPAGNGLLRVSTGWVAFRHEGRESFIPEGAECVTRKHEGPGLPVYEDAPEELRRGVERYDAGDRTAGVSAILGAARRRDGLTLWHLLGRGSDADRARVFDRFAQLVPLPAGVTREAVLAREAHAIDGCWDALNLENTDWWRGWERRW